MKEKIIIFAIGLLVGAVVTSGAFFVYSKATVCHANNNQTMQMPGGNPPSMPNSQNGQKGQLPEMPNNDASQNSDNTQNNNNG